ncbi:MAG: c-type cytochrome [Bacteroidetes bacterium]|jgi:cytochrome c oxidase cbb3-type subunit 3|nr:c-type cytochrome [Bacteroidota bacterium]
MKNNKVKYFISTLSMLFLTMAVWAQDAAVAATPKEGVMEWMLHNMVLVMGILVVLGAFVSLLYLNNMLLQIQKVRLLEEHGVEVMEEVKLLDEESWWSRINNKAWDLVPLEKEKDILLDHNYDGIKELDNVLPPWWVAMFYISIIYGIGYLGYYHFSDYGLSSHESYELEMEEAEQAVERYLATKADMVNESNVKMLTDESELSLGQTIFTTKCVSCHGLAGEGNSIGPNLTDEYWLNGGGIKNVFKTIKYGVPEKGMISWKSQLRASDMQRVSSYILSLQGTNPANPKDPQGETWTGEDEEATEDAIGMK